MIDAVIDASALVLALVGTDADADPVRGRLSGMRLHAPHLIDAEIGNVLRRYERARQLSSVEAEAAVRIGGQLVTRRYPHVGVLAERAWTLRADLSFYDALYVALAERLGVPLLTADRRLANAPGVTCGVELV